MQKIVSLIDKMTICRNAGDVDTLLKRITEQSKHKHIRVAFVNAHAYNLCATNKAFLDDLLACDYILRDGAGMKILYKLLGREAGVNLNGTDLIPRILEASKGQNIAVLGTSSPYLERAAEKITAMGLNPTLLKDGFCDDHLYLNAIHDNDVGVALLSMGMPKQERVANLLAENLSSPALILCGGAIADFMAERFSRAPEIMRRFGLEWVYRLSREPKRLFSRYVIGNFTFLLRVLKMRGYMKKIKTSDKIKVLHVVRQYAPAIGGLESYVDSMATHQQSLGYDCTVLTLNKTFHGGSEPLPLNEEINGVRIRRVPFVGFQRYFIPFVSPFYFKKFDVVHVHNTDVFYDYVALCSLCLGVPAFATTHGGFFHTKNFSFIKKLYFHTVTRFSSIFYKGIFAISEQDLNKFKTIHSDIEFLPNAIEPFSGEISKGIDFVYIGRLAQHKNVDALIKVFAVLKKKHNINGKLHIIGPEWDVKISDLGNLAKSLDIENDVILHGPMSRKGMAETVQQSGYFCSGSSYEGFGMSMLEAMSCGLIPFVEKNDSFVELVGKSKCGLLLDYQNTAVTADAIANYMPTIDAAMRIKAKEFSLLYSWPALTTFVDDFYKKAVA